MDMERERGSLWSRLCHGEVTRRACGSDFLSRVGAAVPAFSSLGPVCPGQRDRED